MLAATPAAQAASTQPASNAASSSASFFKYDGAKPLTDYAPGDVLKSRTIAYHVAGFPIPVSVEQVLYRSTNMLGQAVANVTSIVKPAAPGPLEWLSPLKAVGSSFPISPSMIRSIRKTDPRARFLAISASVAWSLASPTMAP
ncbi:secretory lipase [Renibacterium salmoninarum ATCC 33209]|uniref:Secretory lipase n=1 Tax=Renibacterium salmoninarum (strain ATCC 33209 / DSM 20767 / JCM 11484 / NBRC 15589 / NCIMB 2235) TaxID=288705 RepID=A9WNE5_RENSM|nr:secretory lipase [Renibacterium salmoninarum ATCC 33209]